MSAIALTNAKIFYGGRDLSGISNQVSLNTEVDLQEDTSMGDTYRTRIAGLKSVGMDLNGWWDAVSATDSADADLFAKLGAVKELISLTPEGGTLGDPGYFFEADAASYQKGATVGEIFAFTLTVNGNGALFRSTVMENSAFATTTNGTNREISAVTATETIRSAVHVVAVSGTNPTLDVTVESDVTGFAGPTLRMTHPQFTAVGSNLQSLAGPVTDDFWRLVMTVGGTDTPTFTIFGALSITAT